MAEYIDKLPRRIIVDDDVISGLAYISYIYNIIREDVVNIVISYWIEHIDRSEGKVYHKLDKFKDSFYIGINIEKDIWDSFKKSCHRKDLEMKIGFKYALSEFLNSVYKDAISKGCGIKSINRLAIDEFIFFRNIFFEPNKGYFVYIIYNKDNNICYVGRTVEIYSRISSHINGNTLRCPITDIYIYRTDKFIESCILEKYFLDKIKKNGNKCKNANRPNIDII